MGKLNLGKVRGSQIYTGTKIKGNAGGIPNPTGFAAGLNFNVYTGDLYINTDGTDDANRGNIYKCITGGDANTARWIYNGNIRGPKVAVVDELESYSTTEALSANQGRMLKLLVDDAGVYPKELVFNTERPAISVDMRIEDIDSTFTYTLDGNQYQYQHYSQGGKTATISIGFKNYGKLSQIKSSGAKIYWYRVYDPGAGTIEQKTVNVWNEINQLKQEHEVTEVIEDGAESGRIGNINKVLEGVKRIFYPITHAKAVWYSKEANRTVEDEIREMKESSRNNQWGDAVSLETGKDILIERDGMVKIDGSISSKKFSAVRLTVNGIDVFYQQANQDGAVPTRYVHSFMVYKGDVINGNAADFAYDDQGKEIPKLLFYPQA